MNITYKMRIGNLEARLCNQYLMKLREGDQFTIEIVQWSEDSSTCFTIASFEPYKSDSNYDLRFCGNRPFDIKVNWNDFRVLGENAYNYLMLLVERNKRRIEENEK